MLSAASAVWPHLLAIGSFILAASLPCWYYPTCHSMTSWVTWR